MIDLSDYKLAWQVYLSVGLVASVIWCMLLRRLPIRAIRYWLMAAGVVFLFLPVRHPEMSELWVPSAGAAVLSLLTEGLEAAIPMLLVIAISQILALVVGILLSYVFGAKGQDNKKSVATSSEASKVRTEPEIGLD
ncbi:Uncharacterised protein [Zhongshania aliphaticivorans]|uniref:Uncharacterized protein n=1 Tax=Zhongshania aliphaticivorans TaxID=1470434 RepID=A0A5S9QQF1_9GAMM|nr:hypothetical protein [Zhongshania aliphaticivorans]CAA0088205.1 Uncharacterised protein [Zhongshania aliphaticivorans]CAA0116144.1 Uncharacterised protein [Zhongshania aliphaticivorans]CAA0120376.1 Uncharacterised protein [Zhongshania aliphaticivorans]